MCHILMQNEDIRCCYHRRVTVYYLRYWEKKTNKKDRPWGSDAEATCHALWRNAGLLVCVSLFSRWFWPSKMLIRFQLLLTEPNLQIDSQVWLLALDDYVMPWPVIDTRRNIWDAKYSCQLEVQKSWAAEAVYKSRMQSLLLFLSSDKTQWH